MLRKLKVQDFALMDSLELSFSGGFTVLTGETGAGKSILIDAISYVMGAKFNREFIRSGKNKTSVEAEFDLPDTVRPILAREHIPSGNTLVLFRENSDTGRSSAAINGQPVLVALVREIAPHLLDIHGQHNNQHLLDPENHQSYLDEYGDLRQCAEYRAYQTLYRELKEREHRLGVLTRNNERDKLMDYLIFQVEDIKKHDISEAEEQDLIEKEQMLSHAQKISDALKDASIALSEDQIDSLNHSVRSLRSVEAVFTQAGTLAEVIEEAYYNLVEARRDLAGIVEEVYFDEGELDEINGRLFIYDNLKKKYGDTTAKVLSELERMEEELYELTHAEEKIAALKKEISRLKGEALQAGAELSVRRKAAGQALAKKINSELRFVGLGKAEFQPMVFEGQAFTETGTDEVRFYISTNPGEPQKPLEKIVSGGELSRIMLALKASFIDREGTPTVIFDEIDTGISGRIAQAVGEKMYRIARKSQVLCVTHLPQIAAWSDHHMIAQKEVAKGRTFSRVLYATEEDKVMEIANMLAGSKMTEAILANARELIQITTQSK